MKKIFIIVLIFLYIPLKASENKGNINVVITDFRNSKGEVRVVLFKSQDGFPDDYKKAYKVARAKIKNKKAEITFTDIPFDNYAVTIMHDEDSNGDMDENWLGIPKEGFGASKNPVNKFRAPKFEEAKFNFNSEKLTVEIKAQYF